MARHLLVAMDDSDPARAALEHALKTFPEADVTVLNVADSVEIAYSELSQSDGSLQDPPFFDEMHAHGTDHEGTLETIILEGKPAETIVEYATENEVDQIVIGSAGRSGISRMLLGSVAEAVARQATVPVTIVR